MPHSVRESHLEEICANCRKPHGSQIEIMHQHHKMYEHITCVHCGYESVRVRSDTLVSREMRNG